MRFSKLIPFIFIFTISCGAISVVEDSDDDTATAGSVDQATMLERTDISGSLKLLLPFSENESYYLGQGYGGSFSHSEECDYYALDFSLPEGTDIRSVAAGRVISLKEDSNVGGASIDYLDDTNYVTIDHGFGFYGFYGHICYNCASVEVGDIVTQGQVIAQSGNTGYSTAPHLHFEMDSLETNCSVSYGFYDVADDGGIPEQNSIYLSLNNGSSPVAYTASNMSEDEFSYNGVVLDAGFPWVFTRGESLEITGHVTNGKAKVALFLIADSNWADGASADVDSAGNFTISYTVSSSLESGSYFFAMTTSDTDSFYSESSEYAWVE